MVFVRSAVRREIFLCAVVVAAAGGELAGHRAVIVAGTAVRLTARYAVSLC